MSSRNLALKGMNETSRSWTSSTAALSIYAARSADAPFAPIVPFAHHDVNEIRTVGPSSQDIELGVNASFVPHASLSLSRRNARLIFDKLGFPLREKAATAIDIDAIHQAALRWISLTVKLADPQLSVPDAGPAEPEILRPGYINEQVLRILLIARTGIVMKATHLAVTDTRD
jgi:hypothetical protein